MSKLTQYIENMTNTPSFNHEPSKKLINEQITGIEIIIPVFNGFDALKNCLNSVLNNTNNLHRITLLDDASTDPRVKPLLDHLAAQHNHIKVITRKNNLGYLKNINLYMASVNSDMVLLNADTEVTKNWLDEFLIISKNQHVGIVCPISDNATILTLSPEALIHEKQLSHLSGHWFPVPTAVGFCMFMKKNIINEIGGFDPYYDPGYGEECDYSMLVRQLGYQIACAPASLVKHKGSQSFVESAEQLKEQHQKLLDLRWPYYNNEISHHIAKNPMLFVEQSLFKLSSKKQRVLHIVHGIDNKGGVELFTRELISKFSDMFSHTLLIPKRANKFKSFNGINIDCDIIEIDWRFFPADNILFNLPEDLNNPELDQFFTRLLKSADFNLVHFHSLVGVGTDVWPLICHQLKIPYVFSLHDHKGLCPIFSLSTRINDQEIYCGKSKSNDQDNGCLKCLEQKTQKTKLTTQSYLQTHQQIWHESINNASRLIFASKYLFDKYILTYPNIEKNSDVLEPTFYPSQTTSVKSIRNKKIQIAFLGQFGILKGAQLFIDLYHQLKTLDIDFQIIGGIDPKYKNQLKNTSILLKGPYDRSDLPELLKPIDLIVLTSQIPESYGLTLSEAWFHGVPIVAANVGAYPTRVCKGVNGFLYQNNNLNSLVSTIHKFIEIQNSDSAIKQIRFKSDDQVSIESIEKKYLELATHSIHQPVVESINTLALKPPKTSAYQNMQKWLDAPMTLEAHGDWFEYAQPIVVVILGDDDALINKSQNNIQSLIDQAVFIEISDIHSKQGDDFSIALLIDAGNEINENFGNWATSFSQSDKSIGTSDYALVNQNQDAYATNFIQRFSWHNHCLNNQTVGCALIKINLFDSIKPNDLACTNKILKNLIAYGHNQNELEHFPYFSHLIFDQNWVTNWKNNKNKQIYDLYLKNAKVCLIIESNLENSALSKSIKNIKQQTIFNKHQVDLVCENSNQLKTAASELNHSKYDVILFFRDNIRFVKNNSLEKFIVSFLQTDFGAATIPAARERSNTYIIGKKLGAAQHIQGIGPIHNQTFDSNNDFVECDLLDDDLMMFKPSVWSAVRKLVVGSSNHFQSLNISSVLHKDFQSIGIFKPNTISKKGVPSQPHNMLIKDLKTQRSELIEKNIHLLQRNIYSHSYSNRNTCVLETNLCQFKTPKNLPRVIAFAPGDWASDFYRIKSPMTALAAHNKASVIFLPVKHNFIPTSFELHQLDADVLLLHGFYTDKQLSALNLYRKQLPIKIIISIDDLLTEIPEYNSLSNKIPTDVSKRIKLACSLGDVLLVSTKQLAENLRRFHHNIKVIPNQLSKSVWLNDSRKNTQNKIRIGWAGAGQHLDDLAWLKPLIEQTHTDVQWVFFGDKPKGVDDELVEFHAPVDFNKYTPKLASLNLDVGIAPLVDNSFNSAKSNLKLIEFAALTIPVIASDLTPYKNSPALLLPNDIEQWKSSITELRTDSNKRAELGQLMNDWLNKEYWLEDHLDDWLALFGF